MKVLGAVLAAVVLVTLTPGPADARPRDSKFVLQREYAKVEVGQTREAVEANFGMVGTYVTGFFDAGGVHYTFRYPTRCNGRVEVVYTQNPPFVNGVPLLVTEKREYFKKHSKRRPFTDERCGKGNY